MPSPRFACLLLCMLACEATDPSLQRRKSNGYRSQDAALELVEMSSNSTGMQQAPGGSSSDVGSWLTSPLIHGSSWSLTRRPNNVCNHCSFCPAAPRLPSACNAVIATVPESATSTCGYKINWVRASPHCHTWVIAGTIVTLTLVTSTAPSNVFACLTLYLPLLLCATNRRFASRAGFPL